MKRLGIALFAATMVLCACEKIYTTEELGAIVEWTSSGWSIAQNDLSETVTLVTTYRPMASRSRDTITSILTPGDTVQLHMGASVPGVSIDECLTATIKRRDETDIVCTRGADEPVLSISSKTSSNAARMKWWNCTERKSGMIW